MFYLLPDPQTIAHYVTTRLIQLIESKPAAVLGLATGSTMEPIYQQFIQQALHMQLDVSGVTTFNLDEYIGLGADHPQSYHYYMQQHLFNRLAFTKSQTYLPDGLCRDLAEQCQQYSALIRRFNGIDLQLLGIGSNGHIGFNEPGTSFESRTHVVDLSEQTRLDNGRFFTDIEEVPTQAITLGLQDIVDAKEILLIATGAGKARVMADLYASAIDESMPASIVKKHPKAMIIVDKQAAQYLPADACQPLKVTA